MATLTPTVTQPVGRIALVTWGPITTTNVLGKGVKLADFPDKTIKVYGTFGASGTIVFEGSNDSTDGDGTGNWITLTDPNLNAASYTTASVDAITENTIWIRPKLASGGDGTTSVTCELVAAQNVK